MVFTDESSIRSDLLICIDGLRAELRGNYQRPVAKLSERIVNTPNPPARQPGESDREQEVDDRAPMAKAMDWVSRIISASFMMVLPCLLGYFVDQWLGTWILFTLLGLGLGLIGGTLQLIKLAQLSAEE